MATPALITLPHFTTTDAWSLGTHIRSLVQTNFPERGVSIRIVTSCKQILFSTITSPGSSPDAETWLNRKINTVLRYGVSSWAVGESMRAAGLPGKKLSEKVPGCDDAEFAVHGGAVPVVVDGVYGVVAVVAVSGLKQEEDHQLALEGLRWLKEQAGGEC
ncbi:hypothetical protein BZA77DRAFT_323239 [Pyronema omphalodes]|nr:hypothetical protein BZA77DRAFT_323239 [Pyronema omphalodes]